MTDTMLSAMQNESAWRERVIKAALKCAADNFDEDATDPGWESEMHDERLDYACNEYVGAINFRKEVANNEKKEAAQKVRDDAVEGPS